MNPVYVLCLFSVSPKKQTNFRGSLQNCEQNLEQCEFFDPVMCKNGSRINACCVARAELFFDPAFKCLGSGYEQSKN